MSYIKPSGCLVSDQEIQSLVQLAQAEIKDVVDTDRVFSMKDFLMEVYNDTIEGKTGFALKEAQLSGISYMRMLPRFVSWVLDANTTANLQFKRKGVPTDLRELFNKAENGTNGVKFIKSYVGLDEDLIPRVRVNPSQEGKSFSEIAGQVLGEPFRAAPESIFITHGFEVRTKDKAGNKIEPTIIPEEEFYFKVQRAVLQHIVNTDKSPSNQIDYPGVGPVFISLRPTKSLYNKNYGTLRKGSENPALASSTGIAAVLVDENDEPIKFNDEAIPDSGGKIAYWIIPVVSDDYFDAQGNLVKKRKNLKGVTDDTKVGNNYVKDITEARLRKMRSDGNTNATYEQAYQLVANDIKQLRDLRKFIIDNPEVKSKFVITGGSFGYPQFRKDGSRFDKLSNLNLHGETFVLFPETKDTTDEFAGRLYTKTVRTGEKKIEVERPEISESMANKITSLIFDELDIEIDGKVQPITLKQRVQILKGYIRVRNSNTETLDVLDIFNGENGLEVRIGDKLLDPTTPEESKKALYTFLTSFDINRKTDTPTTRQASKVIIKDNEGNWEKEVKDPNNLGAVFMIPRATDKDKDQYWVLDYPKLNINFGYIKSLATPGAEQFLDVDIKKEGDKLVARPTGEIISNWIYDNFGIGYQLDKHGDIIAYNSYFVYQPSNEFIQELYNKQPELPKGPAPVESAPVQTAGEDLFRKMREALDKKTLNKTKEQKAADIQATEQQMKEAEIWWNNHPLSKIFDFKKMFSAVNVRRPNSIAEWTTSLITLYKGSDLSDIYHESWHAFSQTFLTQKEQDALYKEVGKLSGSFIDHSGQRVSFNMATPHQLEEYLAEDFRSWMLTDGKSRPGPVRLTWYKKILAFLETLFTDRTYLENITDINSNNTIHEIFTKLKVGNLSEYSHSAENARFSVLDKGARKFDETSQEEDLNYVNSRRLIDMMDSLLSRAVDLMNANVFDPNAFKRIQQIQVRMFEGKVKPGDPEDLELKTLTGNKHTYSFTSSLTSPQGKSTAYALVKYSMGNIYTELKASYDKMEPSSEKDRLAKNLITLKWGLDHFGNTDDLTKNPTGKGLISYHIAKSKFYSKSEKDEFFELADEERQEKGFSYEKAGNELSLLNLADEEILYLISSIHAKDKYNKSEYDEFGVEKLAKFDVIWNKLAITLAGTMSVEEMYEKLVEESKHFHPFKQLLQKLGPVPKPSEIGTFDTEQALWTKFWQTFNKTQIKLLQLTVSETTPEKQRENEKKAAGEYRFKSWDDEGPDVDEEILSDEEKARKSSYVVKIGDAYRDFKKVGQRWNSNFKIKGRNKPFIKQKDGENYLDIEGLKSKYPLRKVGEDPYDFLWDIGIELEDHPEIRKLLKQGEGGAYFIYKNLIDMHARGIEVKSIKDIFREYPKTKTYDIIPSGTTNFDILQKLQARYSNEFITFMVQNAEGETQYEHSLNNSMTMIVNTLNSPKVKDFRALMRIPYMQYLDPANNDFAKASIWLNRLFKLRFEKSDLKPGEKVELVGTMIPEADPRYGKRRLISSTNNLLVQLNLINLSGIAVERDEIFTKEGVASANADEFSKLIYDFHMGVDKGYFEMMRHSDKTSSFSVFLSHGIAGESLAPGLYIPGVKFISYTAGGSEGRSMAYNLILPHLSAELERVKRFKKMKQDKVENFDFGFLDAGEKLQLFDSIFTDPVKEKLYNLTEPLVDYLKRPESSELKSQINKELDTYFKGQITAATKLMTKAGSGGFIASEMYSKLRAAGSQVGINNLSDDVLKRAMITSFVMNSWIHNLESLVLFYGDIAQYNHTKEEFHKRNAGMASTGKLFRIDDAMSEYLDSKGNLYAKNFDYNYDPYNGIFNTAVLKDSTITSKYLDEIRIGIQENVNKRWDKIIDNETDPAKKERLVKKRDELIESSLTPYLEGEMKEGDGQGWISFDAYRQLMYAEGEWSDEQEALYLKIVRGETIDKNINITKFFPTKKLQYAGPLATPGTPVMALHKFSLFPLIPNIIGDTKHYSDRLTNLGLLHEKMMKEKIHYSLFKSGSKISTITKTADYQDTLYTDNETREFNEKGEYTKNSIYVAFLKDQLKIAPEFKGKITFSSQMRKLIEDGLYSFGVPVDYMVGESDIKRRESWDKLTLAEKLNGSDKFKLIKRYEDAIGNLTKVKREELLEEMNWREVDGEPTGDEEDLVNFIREQLETQDVGEHELDFLEIDPETGKLRFDPSYSPSADKIERLLNAIIVKRLIKQKVTGENLIQVSMAGFERVESGAIEETITQDNNSYYRGQIDEPTIDKDGNLVLYGREDELYKRAGLKSKGISMTDDLKSAIDYGNGQLDVALNLASETYDAEQDLNRISRNGYWLIKISKNISNEVVKEAGEVKVIGDKIIIPKGSYEIEQISDYIEPKKSGRNFRNPTKAELKKYGSNNLPFYSRGEDGKTVAMKVKISIQGDFKNLLKLADVKELAAKNKITPLKALNILIQDDEWLNKGNNRRMITMMGTRIPTQGLNSMEFMEVYEFFDPSAGNIIILPTEIVAKSGGDFDIDKLTVAMPNISVFNGVPTLIRNMSVKETTQELITKQISIRAKISAIETKYSKLLEEMHATPEFDKLTEKEKQDIKILMKESRDKVTVAENSLEILTNEWTKELAKPLDKRRYDLSKLGDQIIYAESQLAIAKDIHESNRDVYFNTGMKKAQKEEIAPLLKEEGIIKEKIASKSAKSYENEIIDSVVDILALPENYGRLIFPNGTDIVKTVADDLEKHVSDYSPKNLLNADGKLRGTEKKRAISPTRVLEIEYNLYKHKSNNIGKATLGLGAVDNTYNTLFNRIGAYLSPTNGVMTYAQYFTLLKKPKKDKTDKFLLTAFRRQKILLSHNKVKVGGEDAISLSHLLDASGEHVISDVISQLINGWVDIAKDAWIFNIQGNKEVAPTLLFMLQAGVPFKTAVYFASMPLVREYVDEQRQAKSTFAGALGKAPKQKSWFRSEARKTMLKKHFGYKANDFISNQDIYSDSVKATRAYLGNRDFTEEELEKRVKNPSAGITDLDKAAFLHYIEIENLAKPTTQVKMNVNVDTKKSGTLFEAQARIEAILALNKDITFSGDLVKKVVTDSPISSFYIQPFQLALLGDLFPLRNHPLLNDFIKTINPFSPAVDTTFPDDFEGLANTLRNDIVGYVFQNVLHPQVNKKLKDYKGYTVTKDIPLEKVPILKHGAYVDKGNLYVDFNTLEDQYNNQIYMKDAYWTKYQYAKIDPGTFKRVDDYYRFVFEREIIRYQRPYSKIKNTKEFESFVATYDESVVIKKNETQENFKVRREKLMYELFLRDKALDSVYNLEKLFRSDNTYADQYTEILGAFPDLVKQFDILNVIGPSPSGKMNNLRLNDTELTGDKLNQWHEQLLTLANPSLIDIGNEDDKKWIAEFFGRFSIVAFLQSGLNTKGALSLVRLAPVKKWTSLIEPFADNFTENLSNDILQDIFAVFVDQNALWRGTARLRNKDLHSNKFGPELFGGIGESRLVLNTIKLNIIEDWVMEGSATTTLRSTTYHKNFYKGDGVYKTGRGNFVNIEYNGKVRLVNSKDSNEITKKKFTREAVEADPDTAYVFTENTHSITAFPNRPGGGTAVIRGLANAFAIVTKKKYDYNTKENVDYSDTEKDFNEFKSINTRLIEELKDSGKSKIVFPEGFGTGMAKMPTRFAKWLQKELLDNFGLVTELNSTKTGLVSSYIKSENQMIVGEGFTMSKDEFAQAEGYGTWDNFVKNAKWEGKKLQEGLAGHFYNVIPITDQGILENLLSYSEGMDAYIENGFTHYSDGTIEFTGKDYDSKEAEELLKANPEKYVIYSKTLKPDTKINKGNAAFGRVGLENKLGLTVLDHYNRDEELGIVKDVDGAVNPELKKAFDVEIGLMLQLVAKDKDLVFDSSGYATSMMKMNPKTKQPYAPKTFNYISEQLYSNFGYINPGFTDSKEGLAIVQKNQPISDNQIMQSLKNYAARELPDTEDLNYNSCGT